MDCRYPRSAKVIAKNWLLGYDGSLVVVDKKSRWLAPREARTEGREFGHVS